MKYPRLSTEVSRTSTNITTTIKTWADLYSAPSIMAFILVTFSIYSVAETRPPPELPPYWQEDTLRVDLYYDSKDNTSTMDNENLVDSSLDINNSGNVSQRISNYQWLQNQDDRTNNYENNLALGKIAQQFIKLYWQNIKENHFKGNALVPDGDGHGTLHNGLDYYLGLTNNNLTINLSHKF